MLRSMRRRKAIEVLQTEMCLERHAIIGPLLDVFISGDGNEYDSAISYVIARARAIDYYDEASEALILSELLLGSGLVDHSQKMTVAARAMAERKTVGHRS